MVSKSISPEAGDAGRGKPDSDVQADAAQPDD
jgi:hypothetical protein